MIISLDLDPEGNYVVVDNGFPLQLKAKTKEELYEITLAIINTLSLDGEMETFFDAGPRSGKWHKTRSNFIEKYNSCACCNTDKMLQVHHIEPFHNHPEKELDENNLITLCETCHFVFGHLKSWQSYNPNVLADVKTFHRKIEDRP